MYVQPDYLVLRPRSRSASVLIQLQELIGVDKDSSNHVRSHKRQTPELLLTLARSGKLLLVEPSS